METHLAHPDKKPGWVLSRPGVDVVIPEQAIGDDVGIDERRTVAFIHPLHLFLHLHELR